MSYKDNPMTFTDKAMIFSISMVFLSIGFFLLMSLVLSTLLCLFGILSALPGLIIFVVIASVASALGVTIFRVML